MISLCIDTSGAPAVAVVRDGKTIGAARDNNPRRHAEELGNLVRTALDQAGFAGLALADIPLDRICVGRGPGSFTALRAGLIFAATLGDVLGVPVYGVGSLEALGWQALADNPDSTVLVVTDARRREVFFASYRLGQGGNLIQVLSPQVGPLTETEEWAQKMTPDVLWVGDGAPQAEEIGIDPVALEQVVSLSLRADPDADLPATPLYLRQPDVNLPSANQSGKQ